MRTQLEEFIEKGQLMRQQIKNWQQSDMATPEQDTSKTNALTFMNQTIEQLSIFQNKEVAHFRNIDLDSIQKDQKYVRKLEQSVDNLNSKLSKLKL